MGGGNIASFRLNDCDRKLSENFLNAFLGLLHALRGDPVMHSHRRMIIPDEVTGASIATHKGEVAGRFSTFYRYTLPIIVCMHDSFSWYYIYYVQHHILFREPVIGSCAKPAESIKELRHGNREPFRLAGCRINPKNTVDLKKQAFTTPELRANTTTKDILGLLQIFLHIPFKRSMGLAESLFGKCRNGSSA